MGSTWPVPSVPSVGPLSLYAALGVSARPVVEDDLARAGVELPAPSRSGRGPVRTGRSPTVALAPNIDSSSQARS